MLIACATAASLFPFVGTIVYTILRPPEFLEDREERELEIQAAELRAAAADRAVLPALRVPGRAQLPALPELRAEAQGPLPQLRQAARPALGRLPVLRDRGPQARARRERAPRRSARRARRAPRRERAGSRARRPSSDAAARASAPAPAAQPRGARPARRRPSAPSDARAGAAGDRAESARRPAPTGRFPPDGRRARTLILVKPDAFERGLTGEVIARFERKGLRLVALKLMQADEALADDHYAEHTEKPFFGELVEFITGGPLVAMVLEGDEAVEAARQVIGATNPLEAAPGSIRGDFAHRGHLQPGPRLGLRRVGRARDRHLVPRAVILRLAASAPQRRGDPRGRSGVEFEVVARRRSRRRPRGEPARARASRTRAARPSAVRRRRRPTLWCSAGDTEVVVDGEVLGKPADEARGARSPGAALRARARGAQRPGAARAGRGRRRSRAPGSTCRRSRSGSSTTPLLDAYLASGEWRGRAGAYAIQGLGSALVEHRRGRRLERGRPAGRAAASRSRPSWSHLRSR